MAKKITESQMIGDRGIALIKTRVLGMGFLWYETGGTEAGIDGTIEIRDPKSGHATNQIVQVQSRATSAAFTAEMGESFEYLCDERDLAYWLGGNAPVILVCSRPETEEAYFVSIKDYFSTPERVRERRIRFDKKHDSFEIANRDALIRLAVPRESGIYISPPPRDEQIVANLLRVLAYPESIYVAETEFRRGNYLRAALRLDEPYPPREWMLRHGQLYSIYNLRERPWSEVCEVGTVERFDAAEWAESDDPVHEAEFAQLLYACLAEKVGRELRFDRREKLFIAKATTNLQPRRMRAVGQRRSGRMIFKSYESKTALGKIGFCKHWAFHAQFQRYDGDWFLEINPTYHYSIDGHRTSRYAGEYLSNAKRLENNDAVRRQVQMWARYLHGGDDLFSTHYEPLVFGELARFDLPIGVDDEQWLANARSSRATDEPEEEQRLFAA